MDGKLCFPCASWRPPLLLLVALTTFGKSPAQSTACSTATLSACLLAAARAASLSTGESLSDLAAGRAPRAGPRTGWRRRSCQAACAPRGSGGRRRRVRPPCPAWRRSSPMPMRLEGCQMIRLVEIEGGPLHRLGLVAFAMGCRKGDRSESAAAISRMG